MKIFKLKKTDFNDLIKLYSRIGCVHNDRFTFPHHTFVSPKTYKQIEKVVRQQYKEHYPYLNKRKLDSSVNMYLLNLGPSELKGLSDNVILVDVKSIEQSKNDLDANANVGIDV